MRSQRQRRTAQALPGVSLGLLGEKTRVLGSKLRMLCVLGWAGLGRAAPGAAGAGVLRAAAAIPRGFVMTSFAQCSGDGRKRSWYLWRALEEGPPAPG